MQHLQVKICEKDDPPAFPEISGGSGGANYLAEDATWTTPDAVAATAAQDS